MKILQQQHYRWVPAASDNKSTLPAELDALDRALVRPVRALRARVDVERLQDVVQPAGPHVDGVLIGHQDDFNPLGVKLNNTWKAQSKTGMECE